jgi:hypothetical protein
MFGLANTRISTDYVQKSPRTLACASGTCMCTREELGVCVGKGMGSNLAPQQIDLSKSNANVGPLKLIKRSGFRLGFRQVPNFPRIRTSENPVSVWIRLVYTYN